MGYSSLNRFDILIIDEDVHVVETIRSCFPASNYQCVTTTSVPVALKLLKESRFDAVICAVFIGGIPGADVLRKGLELNPQAVFLMTSSPQDWESAKHAMKLGASDCIRKPFLCEELAATLKSALETHRRKAEIEMLDMLMGKTLHERTSHLHNVLRLVGEHQQTLETLVTALDAREKQTNLHALRVQAFTMLLAERCRYDEVLMKQLSYGALLHDIGKIAIPDSILLKPARLTPEEMQVMQQHSMYGYQVLSRVPHFEQAALIALFHHERVDGEGYPMRLKGDAIPLATRIFAVADTLDVIVAGRPYCSSRTMEEARAEICRCSGSQLDSDVVDIFQSIRDEEWVAARDTVSKRHEASALLKSRASSIPF